MSSAAAAGTTSTVESSAAVAPATYSCGATSDDHPQRRNCPASNTSIAPPPGAVMRTTTRPFRDHEEVVRLVVLVEERLARAQRARGRARGQLGDLPLAQRPEQVAAAQRDLGREIGSGRCHVVLPHER